MTVRLLPKPCSLTEKQPKRIKILIYWSESWATRMVRSGAVALLGEYGGAGPSQPGPETALGAPHRHLPIWEGYWGEPRVLIHCTTAHWGRVVINWNNRASDCTQVVGGDRGNPCKNRETSFGGLVSAVLWRVGLLICKAQQLSVFLKIQ